MTFEVKMNVDRFENNGGKCFGVDAGLNVPRSRFLPVKKTSDLLLVMSNLYNLKNGSLAMSSLRSFPSTPLIKLGENHFAKVSHPISIIFRFLLIFFILQIGKVREFLKRFATIPDLLELDHLTVSGDVTFGRNVALKVCFIRIAIWIMKMYWLNVLFNLGNGDYNRQSRWSNWYPVGRHFGEQDRVWQFTYFGSLSN